MSSELSPKPAFDPAKRAFSLWEEFRNFAFKGNLIDLAVAVIIGGAFGKIVDSLVKDIIMPLISSLMPGGGYQSWTAEINGATIAYGKFLGELVNFLIVALAVFVFTVKFLGWIMRARREEQTKGPPPLTKEQELLTEIRDLLKPKNDGAALTG